MQNWLSLLTGKRRRRHERRRQVRSFELFENKVLLAADLSLAISDGDAFASPGSDIVYTFDHANEGDMDAAGVVVRTTVPRGTSFNAEASDEGWNCSESGFFSTTICTFEVGDATAESEGSASFVVSVDEDLSSRTRGIGIAGEIRGDERDANRRNNYSFEETPIDRQLADLVLDLTDEGAEVEPGGTVSYVATYSNDGTVAATGSVLTIRTSPGTSFNADASSEGWVCTEGSCTLDVGEVAVGEGGTATFAVDVAADLSTDVRQVGAQAGISSDGEDANRRDNSDGSTTPVIHALPDLQLRLDDGDEGTSAGSDITYTLDYTNLGTADATGATINMRVPRHTTFDADASSEGWACEEGVCTLDVGTLAVAAEGQATFVVTVDAELSSRVRRIYAGASISDDGENGRDSNRWNNRAYESIAVLRQVPDLAIRIDDGGEGAVAGESLVYTINYQNQGIVGATGVTVSMRIPRGATIDETQSSAGWACENGRCTLDVGELAAGETAEAITLAIVVPDVRRIYAFASISDDGENGRDGNRFNNAAIERTRVTPADEGGDGDEGDGDDGEGDGGGAG